MEAVVSQTMTIVEAAEKLGINRETVRVLIQKGELKGHKKTLARNSPFVIDADSVLEFDRRRREQATPAH
jgi:transposase